MMEGPVAVWIGLGEAPARRLLSVLVKESNIKEEVMFCEGLDERI
jgi:hypothetical protein